MIDIYKHLAPSGATWRVKFSAHELLFQWIRRNKKGKLRKLQEFYVGLAEYFGYTGVLIFPSAYSIYTGCIYHDDLTGGSPLLLRTETFHPRDYPYGD